MQPCACEATPLVAAQPAKSDFDGSAETERKRQAIIMVRQDFLEHMPGWATLAGQTLAARATLKVCMPIKRSQI